MSLLTRYEPRALSTWLDDFFTTGEATRELSGLYPVIEVREEKDHFALTAELPGMSKEDIAIEVKNGVLTISGEKKHERKEEKEGYFYSERAYGRFERSFNLGDNVSEEEVNAEYKDGVLRVTLKKNKAREPRRISVK